MSCSAYSLLAQGRHKKTGVCASNPAAEKTVFFNRRKTRRPMFGDVAGSVPQVAPLTV